MGNRICLRRAVEEQLTRPRRLERQPSGVDYRKLRKLILAGKLAPCFDALDEDGLGGGLEDCPICFLYFPSLNRSVCCGKGICTECFIQMRSSHAIRTIRCPFCKSSCYAVEYRGARTEEEKGLQQAEEQKVLEAKIRMQIESHNMEQVIPPEQTCTILETQSPLPDSSGTNDGRDIANPGASLMLENIMLDSSSILSTYSMRHKECDPGLEKIMLMEALWQSLQDFKLQKGRTHQNSGSSSMVGPESGTDREDNVGTYLSSFDQGELPSLDSLGDETVIATMEDWGIAQQMTSQEPCSESFCHIQTSVDIHRNFIEESNAASSEIELSVDSSSQIESSEYQVADISFCSVGNLVANPFAAGSSSSVSAPSPSNASCECLPHLGRYYSEIIGKMTLEQPFMLITHSNI